MCAQRYEPMRSLWMSACNVTMNGCRILARQMPRLNVEVIREGDSDDVQADKVCLSNCCWAKEGCSYFCSYPLTIFQACNLSCNNLITKAYLQHKEGIQGDPRGKTIAAQGFAYFTQCFGMKLLRKRDIPEERYTNAFLGYGPEDS